ncbi:hypothetical protein ASPFODRAFT_655907 [Aspergillus luchuensis CBS 106.47]|uniref:Uncharacterized protein n=1 Tax=Aspergillus luchuensis (strain CBS 106.47) TaxID=1137211 RepID=A0A1M3TES7_ASPLC|nr:hypothetical protein ASPFODRAFT_655907 [Aspergillus luchuensis CBS 106.47]
MSKTPNLSNTFLNQTFRRLIPLYQHHDHHHVIKKTISMTSEHKSSRHTSETKSVCAPQPKQTTYELTNYKRSDAVQGVDESSRLASEDRWAGVISSPSRGRSDSGQARPVCS